MSGLCLLGKSYLDHLFPSSVSLSVHMPVKLFGSHTTLSTLQQVACVSGILLLFCLSHSLFISTASKQ